MSQKPNQTKVNLNAEKASWLLEGIKPFVADRPLSKSHVAKLVSEMNQGHFLPEITTIMVAKLGGETYRLNGQHTATAVLECSAENPDFVLKGVTLLTFTVSDEAELRQLYARIDRGAVRTNQQVTHSLLAGTVDFVEVPTRILKMLPIGLAFFKFEDPNKRKLYAGESAALDVQGECLELSKQVTAFLGELNSSALHHGHMFRGPVVAALYATFAVDHEDAVRFWQAVATGVGFENESEPAARLRQMLKNVIIGGSMTLKGSKNLIGSENVYRACLHAWNRYREGGNFGQALKPTVLASRPTVK